MDEFIETRLEPWTAIYDLFDSLGGYAFRGQSNCEWGLLTSLERSITRFQPIIASPLNSEYWMLHEFKRKFQIYSPTLGRPDYQDSFEWLAIMQHHGCPTRLLDFTYSLFVAAFFAVIESDTDAAIWAVNRWSLRDKLREQFSLPYKKGEVLKDAINLEHIKLANQFVGQSSLPNCPDSVIPLEPKICTERLSRQQGLFLMPTNPRKTFMQNLDAAFDPQDSLGTLRTAELEEIKSNSKRWFPGHLVLKFVIPRTEHIRVIQDLTRMNITTETLFPGIDGFAKSLLQTELRI